MWFSSRSTVMRLAAARAQRRRTSHVFGLHTTTPEELELGACDIEVFDLQASVPASRSVRPTHQAITAFIGPRGSRSPREMSQALNLSVDYIMTAVGEMESAGQLACGFAESGTLDEDCPRYLTAPDPRRR